MERQKAGLGTVLNKAYRQFSMNMLLAKILRIEGSGASYRIEQSGDCYQVAVLLLCYASFRTYVTLGAPFKRKDKIRAFTRSGPLLFTSNTNPGEKHLVRPTFFITPYPVVLTTTPRQIALFTRTFSQNDVEQLTDRQKRVL